MHRETTRLVSFNTLVSGSGEKLATRGVPRDRTADHDALSSPFFFGRIDESLDSFEPLG